MSDVNGQVHNLLSMRIEFYIYNRQPTERITLNGVVVDVISYNAEKDISFVKSPYAVKYLIKEDNTNNARLISPSDIVKFLD